MPVGPARRRWVRAVAAAGLVVALASTWCVTSTSAAFSDHAAARLGSAGTVGGAYDLAVRTADGTLHEGHPTAVTLDTTGLGRVPARGAGPEPVVTLAVVTTTEATGPVTLTLASARPAAPADPGTGTSADPFDQVLATVSVDGTVVADHVPAAALGAVRLDGWERDVPREVAVAFALLPGPQGNPYYYDRELQVRITLTGSTT
ncbi:hypothetical protein [Cellulomonas biazotea]|uniref:Uncharacterized protein n=1 Tax=Cellulomonas biazotea TaxID=1709 RepID=A0A402DVL0_9CELL|nr:hypothetical protein [Cellulomonas biazotea]GCE78116.1 hypothetical protein CBZ_31720 [Cellulomonas biazotea]